MEYDTTQDDRLLAALAYVLGFFTWIIGPLILYFVKKDQSRFVAFHALQATALQVAISVAAFILGVLGFFLALAAAFVPPLGLLAGLCYLLAGATYLVDIGVSILGAIKAYGGEWYSLPLLGDYVKRQVGL